MEPRGVAKLIAWQKADQLASGVYRQVSSIRQREPWLASQALRAAISVPANIAEGYGRGSIGDYLRFLDIARGSLAELEYYLAFMSREGLLRAESVADLEALRAEVGKMPHGLWRSLKDKRKDGTWDHEARVREEAGVYLFDE